MARYQPEPAYRHGSAAATAVVLINLGTPAAPTAPAVRAYLKEFLSDPRVVEIPRAIWWLILNAIILNARPRKSAAKYAAVWTAEGSPLKVHTERQAKLLRGRLGEAGHHVVVDYAMRYGSPSIPTTLSRVKAAGATRILLLPLYPQYSSSTTATAFDAAFAWAATTRNQPELRTVRSFCDDPGYIDALAASVREHQAEHGKPQKLLMSFHGVPERYLLNGDPYHCECHVTARLLAEKLGLAADEWQVSFQSRFGKEEWIKPYTDMTLKAYPAQGIKNVQVICPGFSADCLETIEEIEQENREYFMHAGGESYSYIPALNARADHLDMLADLVMQHVQGWPEAGEYDAQAMRREWEISKVNALALGAKQ